ncbi:MAG: EAL domain-containing protein [Chlorobi bacterium CHB2]|nr:EAL domain-containing protein [Chlorobi bacterium CHB2]
MIGGVAHFISDGGTDFTVGPFPAKSTARRRTRYSFPNRNIGSDPDDEAVVIATIEGARKRHVRTIAEGVETARQLDFLRAHGCDAAQGYLFCRPLPAVALTGRLLKTAASPD